MTDKRKKSKTAQNRKKSTRKTKESQLWRQSFQNVKLTPDFPLEEWDKVAGCKTANQEFATLRDVIDENVKTLDIDDLPKKKQRELVLKRLKENPDFKLNLMSAGIIDSKRAIKEIEDETLIGQTIVEIQRRAIHYLKAKVETQMSFEDND